VICLLLFSGILPSVDNDGNIVSMAWANSQNNVMAKRWHIKTMTVGLIASVAVFVSKFSAEQ